MRVEEKYEIAQRASGLRTEGMGRRKSDPNVAHATKPELAELIQSMEGKRTPEIPTIAAARGNIVETTPPYHPEVPPREYGWSPIKGWYGTRYGDVGVVGYLRRFFDEVSEIGMSNISDHCYKIAARMADGIRCFF